MNWKFPPHYRLVPEKYLRARLQKSARLCRELDLAGMLFTQAADIFYLSGTMQQGAVFVDQKARPRLFLRRHAGRGMAESPFSAQVVKGFSDIARELALPAGSRLGLALDVMPAREYLGWQKRLPGVELVDISGPWLKLKGVKDTYELEALARAGRIAVQVYEQVPRLLREDMSEAALAGRLLALAMELGAMNLARSRSPYLDNYTWHLVAGPPGAAPSAIDAAFNGIGPSPAFPLGASLLPIRRGDPVIVDIGICYDGYLTDQTRTYCLGPAPGPVRRAPEVLEQVERVVLEHLRPGARSGDIYQAAVDTARELGMAHAFLGRDDHRIKYVGHGTGLELGAPPYLLKGSREKVRAGEVYALELKMVLDQGPVGLENTVVVNQQGPPTVLTPIPGRLFDQL